jgi:hypothetical protein
MTLLRWVASQAKYDSALMMSSRRGEDCDGEVGNLHSLVSIRLFYVGHLRIRPIGDRNMEYQHGKDQVSGHRKRNSGLAILWCVEFECLYATSSGLNESRTGVCPTLRLSRLHIGISGPSTGLIHEKFLSISISFKDKLSKSNVECRFRQCCRL